MAGPAALKAQVEWLITEGTSILAGRRPSEMGIDFVNHGRFHEWLTAVRHVVHLLGPQGAPFAEVYATRNNFPPDNYASTAEMILGGVKALSRALDAGLLLRLEDIVLADAFADLLEQADHLNDGGYFLAAGVLGRAVLEEHLRKWCDAAGCLPAKPKATLSEFYGELYKAQKINKLEQAHVQSMAAVGNDAAHNVQTLKPEDVERLLRDVRDFITRHPLSDAT